MSLSEVPSSAFARMGARRESPFKVKGVLFHGTVAYFEHNCPGGFMALVDATDNELVKDFLRQNFLAGGMYDAMLVPDLIDLEARVMRFDLTRYLQKRTEWQAERDISGVYRMLLKLASPEMAIARLPRVITQMFNFGKPTSEVLAPNHHRVSVSGIPGPLAYWLHHGFSVYCATALKAAGAKRPVVTPLASKPEAPIGGVPMVTLRFEVHWDV